MLVINTNFATIKARSNLDRLSAGSIGAVVCLVDSAIGSIASFRANIGDISNKFYHIIDNLANVATNTEAAKSRIIYAAFAVETTQLTRNTVLQQSATSMISQANALKIAFLPQFRVND